MDNVTDSFMQMAKEGFGTLVYAMLITAGIFILSNLIRYILLKLAASRKKRREKTKANKFKVAKEEKKANPWESEWEKQKEESRREQIALTKEEEILKKRELAAKREAYRLKREQEKWKR